jgi:hypothetical protein
MECETSCFKNIKLFIPEEVRKTLKDRFITPENIQKTIYYAEKTGYKVYNPLNCSFIARHKENYVTYWVEYSKLHKYFIVSKAYSHRIDIVDAINIE